MTTAGAPVAGSSPNYHVVAAPQYEASTDPFASVGGEAAAPAAVHDKVPLESVHHC